MDDVEQMRLSPKAKGPFAADDVCRGARGQDEGGDVGGEERIDWRSNSATVCWGCT